MGQAGVAPIRVRRTIRTDRLLAHINVLADTHEAIGLARIALENNNRSSEGNSISIWQRLIITFVAMLVVSFVVGYVCNAAFSFILPSYVSGVIGGFTALPVWEFLRRVGPSE